MKRSNVMNIIFKNNLVVPNILFCNYHSFGMNEKELLFVSYLMSYEDDIIFDLNRFCTYFSCPPTDIMNIVASLTEKRLISLVTKNENGKIEEYLDISLITNKLLASLLQEEEDKDEVVDNSKVYERIEKEFGRTLSPIECETIKHWLDSKISEDLIYEALKEAVLNGVNNLKYIDKILVEWKRKGYNNKSDVRKKNKSTNEVVDLFEYDWLDQDE